MDKALRPALVWGLVCFLLLYRTLPADVAMWWQLRQQFSVPWVQLVAGASVQIIPAMMPLLCFLCLTSRCVRSTAWLLLPLPGWLSGKFAVLGILYFISLKSGHVPPYAESYFSLLKRTITADWLINTSVFALTIIVCSYAFRREMQV